MGKRKIIATDARILLAAVMAAAQAQAAGIGTVTDLSGPLLARTADGTVKVLAIGSALEVGETLMTRPQGYALASLADHTTVTLGPDSDLTLSQYSFSPEAPGQTVPAAQPGSAQLTLVRGRAHIKAGLLGTREADRLVLHTSLADINLHQADVIVSYSPPQGAPAPRPVAWSVAPQLPQAYSDYAVHAAWTFPGAAMGGGRLIQVQNASGGGSGLNPGLYVQVLEGTINVSNGSGAQNFAAGQFGFTPNFNVPPIILPNNPGLQFNPPPTFSTTTGGTQNGNGGGKPGDVDCVVR